MAFGEVTLIPGVNVERTPTLLKAGFAASSLVRFKDSLVQKYGGWLRYFNLNLSGIPRDLHVWQDLRQSQHLLVGTTVGLDVITNGSLTNITPQTFLSNFAPNFNTTAGSPTVTITDPNISNVTVFDTIFFNTPVSVGGLILFGVYPVSATLGGNAYQITAMGGIPPAPINATATVAGGGAVPVFSTNLSSAIVGVLLNNHDVQINDVVNFSIPTTGNGVTITENYVVTAVPDVNDFNVTATNQATAAGSFAMNSGNVQLVYYIAIGPPASGSGYGTGGYGLGGYGLGVSGSVVQPGTPISAIDWTSANWGEIALACPAGGGVYQWDPTGGFSNASLVGTAPPFNGGIFVSTSEQILVCWGSSFDQAIGTQQDPLLVAWSTVGDYTNFVPLSTDQAGNFRIPIGSKIMGGLPTPNQNIIWTDLDCWAMNYLGPPLVFGFNQIGAGAGLISSHAAIQLRGGVFWMGPSNFYSLTPGGVQVIPCPVWDFVFQNLNASIDPVTGLPWTYKIRAMPNTNFNEAGWLFPSSSSTENDSYVKFNITEPGAPWDIGPANALPRSAWIDQTVLGPPLSANTSGVIFQQETTNDADGLPLNYSFTTGYFYIAEGEDFAIVDQIYPDFRWGFYGQPQVAQVTFVINVVDYPGDAPRTHGPYVVTQATKWISVRIRGRQMSFTISGIDLGSFMRLGHVRYRFSPAGRR